MCGENGPDAGSRFRIRGSPPRVRGKLITGSLKRCAAGITPACAGKTERATRAGFRKKDHPRVCGENPDGNWSKRPLAGSPPRVRGKRCQCGAAFRTSRITPACAGKTSAAWLAGLEDQDHPRVCGENMRSPSQYAQLIGSPPRVRGKRAEAAHEVVKLGITPACAGKTQHKAV